MEVKSKRWLLIKTFPFTDPFAYFTDVIRGRMKVEPYGLYSLRTTCCKTILDAARKSAKEGRTIYFK
jgi:hypothetical protein